MNKSYLLYLLSNVPFLSPLSDAEKRALIDKGVLSRASYCAGDNIITQGEVCDGGMYIVKAGLVMVQRASDITRSSSIVVSEQGAGMQSAAIDSSHLYSANLSVVNPSNFLSIPKWGESKVFTLVRWRCSSMECHVRPLFLP